MPKKKYCRQIVLGREGGKQIRKRIYGNTIAELSRNEAKARSDFEKIRNPSEATFREYSERWLSVYKASRTDNTKAMYAYALSACAAVNPVPVKNIRKTDLQMIISENADHPRMCQVIKLTLNQVFEAAIDDGMILSNPAAKLTLPKYKAKEKRSLTEEERNTIKTADLPDRERLFLDILYYFGLRRGEALALERSDFDFKRLFLCVHKSVAFKANRPNLKATKTEAVRYVPIPSVISGNLKKRLPEEGYLFSDKEGCPLTETMYQNMWKKIRNALGMDIGAHHIRHDYATRLYYVPGISTKRKAEILGHSEQLFLSRYSHIDSSKEDLDHFQTGMTF